MKKFLLICTGIILTGAGLGIAVWLIKKKPESEAIIGGANNPTIIYLAGKFRKKNNTRRNGTLQDQRFTKKDWTLFREKIAGWQEAYMDRMNKEYIELLSGDVAPSEKFWALEKRIKEDRRKKGVRIQMSRSDLIYNILDLIGEGAITLDDLAEFSDELKETVKFLVER